MCDQCGCKMNAVGSLPKKDGKPTEGKQGKYTGQSASPVGVKPGIKYGSGSGKGK